MLIKLYKANLSSNRTILHCNDFESMLLVRFAFMLPKAGLVFVKFTAIRTFVAHMFDVFGLNVLGDVGLVLAGVGALLARPHTVHTAHFLIDLILHTQKGV